MPELYYSYNPDTNEYVGQGEPDPSPLEPGVFLYPAYTTTIKPPPPRNGIATLWSGSSWVQVADHRGETWYSGDKAIQVTLIGNPAEAGLTRTPVAPVPEPIEPTPVNLKELAAKVRWMMEEGGTIWNGHPVHTDRESQNKIAMETIALITGVREASRWKFADGVFRPVTNTQFPEMTKAVRDHVVRAFAIEEIVIAGIEAGTITTVEQVHSAFVLEGQLHGSQDIL